MTFNEWVRELGLRPSQAKIWWKELFRVGAFEWRDVDGVRFVHVFAFEQNQDRCLKKKMPVDKSAKTVDKSVDKSSAAGQSEHDCESFPRDEVQSSARNIVDFTGLRGQNVGVLPINKVNVPLTETETVTGVGAAGPRPPSLPGDGTNGTEPNPPAYAAAAEQNPDPSGPIQPGPGVGVLPTDPSPEPRQQTERGTKPNLDASRGGRGPAAPTPVTAEVKSRLVEDLVIVLKDAHSRAFWIQRVQEFVDLGALPVFVADWEDMKRRILRGEAPACPASKFNSQSKRRRDELKARRAAEGHA